MCVSERRLLVVKNPASKGFRRTASGILGHLEDRFGSNTLTHVGTRDTGCAGNIELIAGHIRPGDVVFSAGGDGTANLVANGIVQSEAPDVSLAVLPGGNGNDISLSIYGEAIRNPKYVASLLENGQSRPFSTIRVERTGGIARHAMGYVSLGASAAVAERFSNSEYRRAKSHHWLGSTCLGAIVSDLTDGVTLVDKYFSSRGFMYEENGELVSADDMLFVNVHRMVKVLRMSVDTASSEAIVIEHGGSGFPLSVIAKLLLEPNGIRGQKLTKRELLMRSRSVINFDGEAEGLKAGDHITICTDPRAIKVLMPSVQ